MVIGNDTMRPAKATEVYESFWNIGISWGLWNAFEKQNSNPEKGFDRRIPRLMQKLENIRKATAMLSTIPWQHPSNMLWENFGIFIKIYFEEDFSHYGVACVYLWQRCIISFFPFLINGTYWISWGFIHLPAYLCWYQSHGNRSEVGAPIV